MSILRMRVQILHCIRQMSLLLGGVKAPAVRPAPTCVTPTTCSTTAPPPMSAKPNRAAAPFYSSQPLRLTGLAPLVRLQAQASIEKTGFGRCCAASLGGCRDVQRHVSSDRDRISAPGAPCKPHLSDIRRPFEPRIAHRCNLLMQSNSTGESGHIS